jgi:hypothetical protein
MAISSEATVSRLVEFSIIFLLIVVLNNLCEEFSKDPGADLMSLPFSCCWKRKSRSRQDATLSVTETLTK